MVYHLRVSTFLCRFRMVIECTGHSGETSNVAEEVSLTLGFKTAAMLQPISNHEGLEYTGFSSASHLDPTCESVQGRLSSPSPIEPPENNLSNWYKSTHHSEESTGSTSAKSLAENDDDEWFTAPAPRNAAGFQSAKRIHSSPATHGTHLLMQLCCSEY